MLQFTLEDLQDAVSFLLHVKVSTADGDPILPVTRWSAHTFFYRYLHMLEDKPGQSRPHASKESLQLICLMCLWTASKIHETKPLTLQQLKDLTNLSISDQHFAFLDLKNAEKDFLMCIKHRINSEKMCYLLLEKMISKLRLLSRVGKQLKLQTCMDIFELLHETSFPSSKVKLTAAAILVAAHVLTVPKGECRFPLLAWVSMLIKTPQEDVRALSQEVLIKTLLGP